jgi:DNA helicase-2/ATP-dependent DNA helicase PcrA
MSMDSIYQIEEERRLLYVAITRAEVNCVITFATSRYHNGQTKTCVMSRFLRDIAPEYLLMGSTNSAPMPTRKRSRWDDDNTSTPRASWEDTEAKHRPSSTWPSKAKPTSSPRSTSPAPPPAAPAATIGNFNIHVAEELHEGCQILHQRFGKGTVTSIDTSGSDAKIDVLFADGQPRKLLLKFAKFEIL